jgi:heme exporter protein A
VISRTAKHIGRRAVQRMSAAHPTHGNLAPARTSAHHRSRIGPGLAIKLAPLPQTYVLETSLSPSPSSLARRDQQRDHPRDVAPLLTARGVACERGLRRLFSGVDLDVRAGEVVWLRGRNGRGKTSLMRLIAGVVPTQTGAILFDGAPRHSLAMERRTLFIGHANALKDDLTVAEALEFLLRIHGHACDAATTASALARWDMQTYRHTLVRALSQGQKRRVALARLAVDCASAHATLWVLDEPFDSLDAGGVDRLNELLAEHLRHGGSVLITGHQSALDPALPQRDFDLDRCVPDHAAPREH